MSKFIDLAGQRFGQLTVIQQADDYISPKGQIHTQWLCQCACKNRTIVRASDLKSGRTQSCGCYQKKQAIKAKTKHGMANTKLYEVYCSMKRRCESPKDKNYKYYGGRGITISREWDNFVDFYLWSIENGYGAGLSIDRIDVNGNYEPHNCRWANDITQAQNQQIRSDNSSGVAGVRFNKGNNKWAVQINVNNKRIYLGIFNKLEDAICARKEAEMKYWGWTKAKIPIEDRR